MRHAAWSRSVSVSLSGVASGHCPTRSVMSVSTGTSCSGVPMMSRRPPMVGMSGPSTSVAIIARVASGAYRMLTAMTASADTSDTGSVGACGSSMRRRHSYAAALRQSARAASPPEITSCR